MNKGLCHPLNVCHTWNQGIYPNIHNKGIFPPVRIGHHPKQVQYHMNSNQGKYPIDFIHPNATCTKAGHNITTSIPMNMHIEALKYHNTDIHDNVKEVSVQKCTTNNLINKSSYPNQVTNNITKNMSNCTSINEDIQRSGDYKLHMATNEIPQLISKVGLYKWKS